MAQFELEIPGALGVGPVGEAVIFDMDGLIFDTESIARWAWKMACAELNYDMADSLYTQLIGRNAAARKEVLIRAYGKGFPFDSVFSRRLARGDEREVTEGLPLKAGVFELLGHLKHLSIPCAVATGTVRERALRRLRQAGIERSFQILVCGDEVVTGKPEPDIFLETARRLAVPPEKCLVLEDSSVGVMAAHAAGMVVVLIPDLEERELRENGPQDEAQATLRLTSLVELVPRFRKRGRD